jgi:tetratricopeptide (TPR) repeat protein
METPRISGKYFLGLAKGSGLILASLAALGSLLFAPGIILAWMIHRRYERGDHKGAKQVLDRFGWLGFLGSMQEDFRALVFLYAGEADQAEATSRAVLRELKHPVLRAAASNTLGQALLDQGRYAEAEATFGQVIEGRPEGMDGYDGLAEIRILQGRFDEAFGLTDQAIQFEQTRSALTRAFEAYEQGHMLANRAWAQAALGRRAEAEQTFERAFHAARLHKPEMAAVNYRAGLAWTLFGNPAKAHDYFQAARELDPEGRNGKKARAADMAHAGPF